MTTDSPDPAAAPVVQLRLFCVLPVTAQPYSMPVGPNVTVLPHCPDGPSDTPVSVRAAPPPVGSAFAAPPDMDVRLGGA